MDLTLSQLERDNLESETAKKLDGISHSILQICLDYAEQMSSNKDSMEDIDWLRIQNLIMQTSAHILDLILKLRREAGALQRVYAGTGERLE